MVKTDFILPDNSFRGTLIAPHLLMKLKRNKNLLCLQMIFRISRWL